MLSTTEQATYIITAQWENPDTLVDPIVPDPPEKGDRIPDSWQYVVNYEVKNGTLSYGGQDKLPSAETVVTRRDDAGTPCNGGTARLAAAHVATDTPIENYGNAKWYIKNTDGSGGPYATEWGNETAAPAEGTVITGNVTYTVVYSAVKVTAVPNGGVWKNLTSNWKDAETSGNKVSALNNGSVTLPAAANITQDGKTLDGWKADDTAQTLYAPGASVSPDKDLTVTAQWAGLEITKTADPTSNVKESDTITYKITVKNTGNVDLTGVVVTDSMKDKVTLTSGDWTIGDLAHGESKEITYTYTVAKADVAAGKVLNTATVKGYGPNGTEPEAKTGEVKVETLGEPAMSVTKEADKTTAELNDVITFTITVENTGNVDLSNITVSDPMMPSTVSGTIASLAVGATETISYQYTVTAADVAAGKVSNTVTVTGENPDGENPDNETDTEEVTIQNPNLTITKSATDTVKVGEDITYTITVENIGDADATNAVIYDRLDSSLGLKSVFLNGEDAKYSFNPNANAIHVTVGTLTSGSKAQLVIVTTAKAAGIVTNKANTSSTETGSKDSNVVTTTVEENVVVKTVTVTWVDGYNSAPIQQETITEGSAIPANPTTAPDHESDGYRFTGWSQPVRDSDGNITITANYEPIPADEKINVTWVDGYNGDILKGLPGVYDKGTLTIPEDQYPAAPAHAGYTFEQWTTQILGNGDIIITANYRTLVVNPGGPSFADLTELGITVEVECETNATHAPEIRSYSLMEGSYETIVNNGSCTLIIYNDLYTDAYGGGHSLVGQPAKTIMLEYVIDEPAQQNEDAGEIDEADSNEENADDTIENGVGNDIEVTDLDNATDTGSESDDAADNSGEGTNDGAFTDVDGDEAGTNEGDSDSELFTNSIDGTVLDQTLSFAAVSYAAPITGHWVIAADSTNTVRFTVRCEEPVAQTHTVTWENWNGTLLDRITVENGVDVPSSAYTGNTPNRPADGQYTYTFSGWSAPSVDATGNVTYTAQYTPTAIIQTHTVTWLNWNGVQLDQQIVNNGDTEPGYAGTTPIRPSDGTYTYTFSGWSTPVVDADGNITYIAQYTPSLILPEGPDVPVGPVTPVTPTPTPTPGGTTIPDVNPPLAGNPDDGMTIDDGNVPLAGAVGLNSVDHFAYVIGYNDDTVQPLNNITRAEVATIFFRLMTDEYRNANWSTSNSFSDVQAGDWFNNAISTCANAGALTGYTDGSFKPNASITRAEFAAVAARFLDPNEYTDDGTGDFSDTAGHWAAKEIRLAAKAGWIRGDGNKFRPDDFITRAEVMTAVNRMLDRVPDADHMLETMKKWTDNPEGTWYYEAVQEATNEHAYERDELGVVETWTEILEARDWKALEESWANANAQ